MKGKIDEIQEITTKTGKIFYSVVIDGEQYSLWDLEVAKTLQKGNEVEFEYKLNNNYKNIQSIEVVGSKSAMNLEERVNELEKEIKMMKGEKK